MCWFGYNISTLTLSNSAINCNHVACSLKLDLTVIYSLPVGQTEKSMNEVIGHVYCALEGRFTQVRTRETNLGTYICALIINNIS